MRIIRLLASLFLIVISLPVKGQFNFSATGLSGVSITNPTSLDIGPDGRLYVSVQSGEIYAFTVQRQSANSYVVTATETILQIQQIANHDDDDGAFHNVVKRQVTGILVAGTAENPILYITSSDYRIGGGGGGSDKNLDSNSGIISRLSWDGSQWIKVDLVRGLPRSEENHATNGLQLDTQNNILYVASGGNTNAGSPSNNFAFLCEYALSSAVLTIDLNDINSRPVLSDPATGHAYIYDLPTLDDPTRPNINGITNPAQSGYDGVDVNDPFGGNDGLNQAKWIVNGPVQVYASGFRNVYDVVLTQDGKLYTWDNGANQGWGGHPANEGVGTATNNWVQGEPGSTGAGPNDAKVNNKDGLHFISGQGYFGGHPNPVRANPAGAGLFTHDHNNGSGGQNGVWRTSVTNDPATSLPVDWPPVDLSLADPIEGDFQNSGIDDASIFNITASTNGMAEYRGSNFNGQLEGALLAASFNGNIYSVKRNAAGSINNANDVEVIATGFGAVPLDVISQADDEIFPGTIWAATYGSNSITIFEPQDFSSCTGVNDATLDEDQDGYTNADEIENGTNPCSGASFPADNDRSLINGFLVSDLNDPDDDDDGLLDTSDYFALDAQNGSDLNLTFDYPLLNGDPGFGLFGLGFTGFMSNGSDDYLDLFKTEDNSDIEIIAGGAVGLLSFNNAVAGKPFGSANNLQNGFQFGLSVDHSTLPFEIEAGLVGPLFQSNPQGDQFHGFYLGSGDQDNYFMLAANANQGHAVLTTYLEVNGVLVEQDYPLNGLTTAAEISLYIEVNPLNGTLQAKADLGNGKVNVGGPISFPSFMTSIFTNSQALALGVAAGKSIGDPGFNATWDFIIAHYIPNTLNGEWTFLNDGLNCSAIGHAGSCPQGRHEASYVEAGEYFVLLGGREQASRVNLYHPATDVWTVGATPPVQMHHFQAIEYQGLVYVLGAMTGAFPNETLVDHIYIYDPLANLWHQGPEIPLSRRRGSGGVSVYKDKFYWSSGIQNGHNNGWVSWFDEFDPSTNIWTTLTDAPRARDHFQSYVVNNKLYLAGGRQTGLGGVYTGGIAEVDVYDFNTQVWSTLAAPMPQPMGANAVALIGNELLYIGGENAHANASRASQALDLNTGTWRFVDSLNQGRHGTQAIVNNQVIYLATGSPVQGGGQVVSQEVFSFGPLQAPSLNPSLKGNLVGPASIDYGSQAAGQTDQRVVWLKNTNGDQALIIDSIFWQNASTGIHFNLAAGLPLHLSSGDSVALQLSSALNASFIDNLVVLSSASNLSLSIPVHAQVIQVQDILINCGGPNYTTINGELFAADQYFVNGAVYQKAQVIGNTDNDDLYHSERYHPQLQYAIPVAANGSYRVDLHFAEIYAPNFLSGARVFDVFLEGAVVQSALDIYDTVGGASALVLSYAVTVSDGSLEIALQNIVENAKLSAIAVRPQGPALIFEPAAHHFQSTALTVKDSIVVNLRNTSASLATIDSIRMVGAQALEFNHSLANTSAIPGSYTSAVSLFFEPLANTPVVRVAQLQVFYDGEAIPSILNLSGEAGCLPAGLSCDDGNANTQNDTTDGNCNCHGSPIPNPPSFSLHINAGGPAYTAADGTTFTADQFFVNGNTAGGPHSIAGTLDPELYATERWFENLAYEIPVPAAGDYKVTLYFAEIWSGAFAINQRVFDLSLEGSLVINDLDLFSEVGAQTAYQVSFTVPVADGVLSLASLASINNTKLSALSIQSVILDTLTPAYLSSNSLNFNVPISSGLDSALIWLVNPDTVYYIIDSIVKIGATPFQIQPIANNLLAMDSLALWVYFDAANLNSGSFAANFSIYLDEANNNPLLLEVNAQVNCLAAGTSCNDGDSGTQNDMEDGNCNCAGTPISNPSFSLNINCGGPSYISTSGETFIADQYFGGGIIISTSSAITQTSDPELYLSSRMGRNMSYNIPVPTATTYQVTLHFAEIQNYLKKPNARVFDMSAEGQIILDDFDIFTEAGGGAVAYSQTFSIFVSDGELNLQTAASIQNSLLSAIEIRTVSGPPGPSGPALSLLPSSLALSAYIGQSTSASFSIINADTIHRTLDSIQWEGDGIAYLGTTLNPSVTINAQDTLVSTLNLSGTNASISSNQAQLLLFIDGDTLILDIEAETLCLAVGTSCNDGDPNTTNDLEDGNCNCSGTPPNAAFSLNINCGGPAYLSALGKSFTADQYNLGGIAMSSTHNASNTSDAALYQNYRMGRNMGYAIPVPQNGTYQVVLHFAEMQNYLMRPNARVFDLTLEGQMVLQNLDVFSRAGAGANAYTQTFTVTISDGELDIATAASSENSVLSAIEITEVLGGFKMANEGLYNTVNEDAVDLELYPNPWHSGNALELHLASAEATHLVISNSMGAMVYQNRLGLGASHSIEGLNLKPGVYLVHAVQGKKDFQVKLIVK